MKTVINSNVIYETVKHLCVIANTKLPYEEYQALNNLYDNEYHLPAKNVLSQILQNAMIASDTKRPLCQDTGFVTVFADIGQDVLIEGEPFCDVINKAVSSVYNEKFYRKSIVSDPLFERCNTNNNVPVVIHTKLVDGNDINLILSVKGGGCENISVSKMLTPAQGIDGVKEFVIETVKNAGSKPCPPIKIGIGIGSNFEGAAILSKRALLVQKNSENLQYASLEKEILEKINALDIGAMGLGGMSTCFGVNILYEPCHMASLPVAISISCHSSRHAAATIKANDVEYYVTEYDFIKDFSSVQNSKILNVNDIDGIRNLQIGENILLSGKIFTARDAAHKKFEQLIKEGKSLPIDIKNAVIFYAGPCPAAEDEVIGPIGPTTSSRMDKYASILYENGLLATIGKGERSDEVISSMKKFGGRYFCLTGGVASLLKTCVKSANIVAYPELGAEAVYELEVEKLPAIVKN